MARRQSCSVLVQIGHILYSGIMPWLVYDGTAGAMLAPVIFAMLVLLGAVILLTIFIATQASFGPVCSMLMFTLPYCICTLMPEAVPVITASPQHKSS